MFTDGPVKLTKSLGKTKRLKCAKGADGEDRVHRGGKGDKRGQRH